MKIAISTDHGNVSAHFGRCPDFTIVEIENGEIIKQDKIKNPGHHPGFLPEYFDNMGISAVIAGGAGQRAQMLFEQKNIQLILGVTGPVDNAINLLCEGRLKGGESLCQPGGGKGYGVEKTECDHEDDE